MQFHPKFFNPAIHEMRKALSVKNPYAGLIAEGLKTIEVRSKNTSYRGDLVICSGQFPIIEGYQSGCTLAVVELYDVKPLEELTDNEWQLTYIPDELRASLTGYGWLLRNPRKLIEYPTKGQLGIFNLVRNKGEFEEYPAPGLTEKAYAKAKAMQSLRKVDPEYLSASYNPHATRLGCFVLIFCVIAAVAIAYFIVIGFSALFSSVAW